MNNFFRRGFLVFLITGFSGCLWLPVPKPEHDEQTKEIIPYALSDSIDRFAPGKFNPTSSPHICWSYHGRSIHLTVLGEGEVIDTPASRITGEVAPGNAFSIRIIHLIPGRLVVPVKLDIAGGEITDTWVPAGWSRILFQSTRTGDTVSATIDLHPGTAYHLVAEDLGQ